MVTQKAPGTAHALPHNLQELAVKKAASQITTEVMLCEICMVHTCSMPTKKTAIADVSTNLFWMGTRVYTEQTSVGIRMVIRCGGEHPMSSIEYICI